MFNKKKQSGSALLLALLIMSAILSSTLYINILSIRHMRQSQNIDNSIVAFYAAESGNEQAIYYIRKDDDLVVNNLAVPGGSIIAIDGLFLRNVTDELDNIIISLNKDEFYQVDVFDQDDIIAGSNLERLDLNWDDDCNGESWIEFTVNEWSIGGEMQWGIGESQEHIKKCLLNEPPLQIEDADTCIDFKGANAYQLRLKALYCNISNLSIKAYEDVAGNTPLPFKNIYNIRSVGEHPANNPRANRQALNVNLRKFSPLSGLFDYVIFSEKSLVKDIGAYTAGWYSEELFVTTNSLPNAVNEQNYNFQLMAVNGTPPYSWSLQSGSLPQGILLSNNGILSGSPDNPGDYLFTVNVNDGIETATKLLLLIVEE